MIIVENPFAGKHTVGLRVENLTFAYGDGPAVLDGVCLHITPGEKLALVGASGGGKSTWYRSSWGFIRRVRRILYFDGVPVEQIGLDVVRDNVATVLQHPAMFNDTVRVNLCLGRDLRMTPARRPADGAAYAVVARLPLSLDTIIGRSGIRLSGGQRQRLAIARMILADPQVVILDEATSALDTETEARLHGALERFLAGRTTLIIAHRLGRATCGPGAGHRARAGRRAGSPRGPDRR